MPTHYATKPCLHPTRPVRVMTLDAGIFLMGYGLVAIPRLLWRTADDTGQRRMLTHQAGLQADKAIAARL